jgi:hypothetical protein
MTRSVTKQDYLARLPWIDILFPAVLLHLGQGALVWAFHSTFLFTTVLGGLFVAVAVAAPPHAAAWRALALAIGCRRGTRDFTPLYRHYSTLAVPVAIGLVWAALPEPAAP